MASQRGKLGTDRVQPSVTGFLTGFFECLGVCVCIILCFYFPSFLIRMNKLVLYINFPVPLGILYITLVMYS